MRVADIQRFCMHDGPGIRTTVFLKGCPLGCLWCHNPETQSRKRELLYYEKKCIGCGACTVCRQKAHRISQSHTFERDLCIVCGECAAGCPTGALEIIGKEYTVRELFEMIGKDRAFYAENGGVTISGGEPFMQAEETISLLRLCRENGIHTAVETCGYFSSDTLPRAVPAVDLFLWDIKDTSAERHRVYTGVSNEKIIDNLRMADDLGAKTRIRCIMVNGVNMEEAHFDGLAKIISRLHHCTGVELIPYHSFGGAKSAALGRACGGKDDWIPTKEQMMDAKNCLRQRGVPVFGGT